MKLIMFYYYFRVTFEVIMNLGRKHKIESSNGLENSQQGFDSNSSIGPFMFRYQKQSFFDGQVSCEVSLIARF